MEKNWKSRSPLDINSPGINKLCDLDLRLELTSLHVLTKLFFLIGVINTGLQ